MTKPPENEPAKPLSQPELCERIQELLVDDFTDTVRQWALSDPEELWNFVQRSLRLEELSHHELIEQFDGAGLTWEEPQCIQCGSILWKEDPDDHYTVFCESCGNTRTN